MKKLYTSLCMSLCTFLSFTFYATAQNCSLLQASVRTYESRCASTGSIKVIPRGGSGNYKYRTTGPVNTNFTSIDSITGLSAGTYAVIVTDITTNCTITISNVVIPGTYQDPRFSLTKTDVSCDNGNNGSIRADSIMYGRQPYNFRIISPSPMGVGTNNSLGIFNQLRAGDYTIQMTDSCGGIQTRHIVINNYTWRIDAYPFTQNSCNQATGFIRVVDSRGNISTSGGIPGFTYGIVRTPGDTIWSANPNFSFSLNGHSSFQVIARDACGIIKKGSTSVSFIPSINANVSLSNFRCNQFNASIGGASNLFNPSYCLYTSAAVLVSCNNTGVFNNLPYGSYCLLVHDSCSDSTIRRCFTANPPPISVAGQINIIQKTCRSFTATVGNTTGLSNPDYCLLDSAGVQISCNTTGVFTGLAYGSYCMEITDHCRDTSFTRCFSAQPPRPVFHPLAPSYMHCDVFGIVSQADSLSNPYFCLLDSAGQVISCNQTGIFDSIPYGNYCVQLYDSCYDITLTQCISLAGPSVHNDLSVRIDYIRCQSFNVNVHTQNSTQQYCLYTAAGVLVSCNTTGSFVNIPSGNYCVEAQLTCPDSSIRSCFRLAGPVPSVGATPSFSNLTCDRFTVSIPRQDNLSNPQFCLYNSRDSLIGCNTTGTFTSIPYGTYCIRITTGCYDTTITRCFTRTPVPVNMTLSSVRSCTYGYAQFNITLAGAVFPATLYLYRPDGSLYFQRSLNRTTYSIDSLPGIPSGQRYKIVVIDQCGRRDSTSSGATASFLNRTITVTPKCPSGTWTNGSGSIRANLSTNLGRASVRIIKKNGITYSPVLSPNQISGGNHTFNDLGPGTYILRSSEDNCGRYKYDTVTINPYQFPNLTRSAGYQCDANGFSVSAVASNGVGPFMYEIIGSVPSSPSIVTTPRANPVFNINNGNTYSLIRLRAVDACGNATLGDASILPLANNGIIASNNCFQQPTTLHVDEMIGATYNWYKKDSLQAPDSTLISTGNIVSIPILSAADTGIYICHLSVNAGCIRRTYRFNLNGLCYGVLADDGILLKGRAESQKNQLFWTSPSIGMAYVERSKTNGSFEVIGQVDMTQTGQYNFTDPSPLKGMNLYRLRILHPNQSVRYSNFLALDQGERTGSIQVYPNPVTDQFRLQFPAQSFKRISITLKNMTLQTTARWMYDVSLENQLTLTRPAGLQAGIYLLMITDMESGKTETTRVLFR